MQLEIDALYQNIPVKATLKEGVTLVWGDSATGKSFFFTCVAKLLSLRKIPCLCLGTSDTTVSAYLCAEGKQKEELYNSLLSSMKACSVILINSADIFVTPDMILDVLADNSDKIILLETKLIASWFSLNKYPFGIAQMLKTAGSLILSERR